MGCSNTKQVQTKETSKADKNDAGSTGEADTNGDVTAVEGNESVGGENTPTENAEQTNDNDGGDGQADSGADA